MVESFILVALVVFFVAGYLSRSYVGVLVPTGLLVFVLDAYRRSSSGPPDEIDVLRVASLVAGVLCVLVYLAGVALGRRARGASDEPA